MPASNVINTPAEWEALKAHLVATNAWHERVEPTHYPVIVVHSHDYDQRRDDHKLVFDFVYLTDFGYVSDVLDQLADRVESMSQGKERVPVTMTNIRGVLCVKLCLAAGFLEDIRDKLPTGNPDRARADELAGAARKAGEM